MKVSKFICRLACLFMLNLMVTGSNAQTSIQGRIMLGGEPLPFAGISLDEGKTGTIADSLGYYKILDLEPGRYEITASFVGLSPVTRSMEVKKGEKHTLHFLFKESARLEEIVITGTLKPTFVSESPVKVEVITSKQLNTYMPAASSSIIESIQLVNGIQEVVACGVCFTNSISINGLPGPYTAILMDGTPIYGNLASVYGLNGIPNMIIDRLEVIRGPSSTLYGSEAVAGVINIITKDPAEQPVLSVDIMGTSHLKSFGNLAIAPYINNTSGYVGLNYAYINDFDDANGDGFGDVINLDRYSLFTKWNIGRKSGKKFTIAGKYYYEDRRNGVESYLENRAYRNIRGNDSIYGESIYTKRLELFGTYELPTKPLLKIDYSFSNHLQNSYYGADYYEATQNIGFANFMYHLPRNKHYVIFGLTARYQNYDDNTTATRDSAENGIENTPDNQYIPGIFIQDEWRVTDKWTLLGGGRLDYYSAHGVIFSPRLNIKYKPADRTTLRSNFGTGFRIVNLFTEDHAFVTGQRTVEIRESLRPEKSYNTSLNFNQVFALGNGSGTFDVDGYYTYFTNKIIPDYGTPGKIIYENSGGHAQTMGLGGNVTYSFAFPLNFNLGWNYQRSTETEPDENGVYQTRDLEFAPRWSGVISVNYLWREPKLTFAYTINITGPMSLPEVYDINDQGEFLAEPRPMRSQPFAYQNIQISREFKRPWLIYAGIQNLANYRQEISPLTGFNDPNTSPGFSDRFDTGYAYSSLHGIEFYLGIKWDLLRKS